METPFFNNRIVIAIRHGRTDRAELDIMRPLNQIGMAQTAKLRAFLAESGLVPEFVLESPALRAHQTSQVLVEAEEGSMILPELYLPDVGTQERVQLDALSTRLGYAPLSAYVAEAPKLMHWYGNSVAVSAHDQLLSHGQTSTIALVGHAVLIPAALAVMYPERAHMIAGINMGEASCIIIRSGVASIEYFAPCVE